MRHRRLLAGVALLAQTSLVACAGTPAASPSAGASVARSAPASASPAASGLLKVKAAYSQLTGTQGVLYVAVAQKFFQRYGLDVDAGQVAGPQQPPAMQAGEIQFGVPGGNELISVNVGGLPVVMIAAVTNVPVVSLWGAKGVNDLKDLSGKTIAVTSAGSATDAAAQIFLRKAGLDKDVKRQSAGTSEATLAVMQKGEVAGGIIAPPATVLAGRDGMKELVNGPKSGAEFVQSGISVSREYLKNQPGVVRRFLQGYYDAWKFSVDPANEKTVEQVITKWTKTDAAAAKDTYEFMIPAWSRQGMPLVSREGLQSIAALSSDPKTRDANVDQFFDNSLLQSIAGK